MADVLPTELLVAQQAACERNSEELKLHPERIASIARGTRFVVATEAGGLREPITAFHSNGVPAVSLEGLARVLFVPKLARDAAAVEAALVLMDRFSVVTGVPVTLHMMHRLYVACLLLASKAHQDEIIANPTLAKCSGIQIGELNRLERILLAALGWRVQVTRNDMLEVSAKLDADSWIASQSCTSLSGLREPADPGALVSPILPTAH